MTNSEFRKVCEAYQSMVDDETDSVIGQETGELYPGEFSKMTRERKLREMEDEDRERRRDAEYNRRLDNAKRGELPVNATKEEQDEYAKTIDMDEMEFVKKSRQDIWNHLRNARKLQMAKDMEYIRKNYKPEVAAAAAEDGADAVTIKEM